MAKHGPLNKPSKAQLPLMIFMADNPHLAFVCSSSGSHSSYHISYQDGSHYYYPGCRYETEFTKDDAREEYADNPIPPEIPKNFAFHRLLQSGWFKNLKKKGHGLDDTKEKKSKYRWAWYDHPYVITKEGIEVANKHRVEYEENLRKKDEDRAKVNRLIIVNNRGRWGTKREYAALCRVTKETAKRLYVEVIAVGDETEKSYGMDTWVPSIEGTGKNKYISRDKVTKDGVTEEEYFSMRKVETSHRKWLADLEEQEEAEMQLIRDRYDLRRKQGEAMFADEVREVMENLKS